jgi:YD repeat-containing protein
MKTTKIYSAITILFTIFATSCSSDSSSSGSSEAKLIREETTAIDGGSSSTIEYTFDANGRLASQLTATESITYSRNSEGKIIQAVIDNGTPAATRILTYTYNTAGKLEKMERKKGATLEEKRLYSYFSDRVVEKYYNVDGLNIWDYVSYYTPDGKNIAKYQRNYGGSSDIYDYTIYNYDNKVGLDQIAPYNNLPKPFYNTNNATQSILTVQNGATYPAVSYNYTYDGSGHPLTMRDAINGKTTTYIY